MKRKTSPSRTLSVLLVLLAVLSGCSKKEPAAPPAEPAKAPAQPAPKPAVPVQKQVSSAVLAGGTVDFSKKTDPFKPYGPAVITQPSPAQPGQGAGQQAPQPRGEVLPIQSFEVSKFKVAGIIAGLQENRALVIDPNGKGYVVQTGMQIGNNNGRISRITASAVEVVEKYKEGGRTKSRTIVLTLAKKR